MRKHNFLSPPRILRLHAAANFARLEPRAETLAGLDLFRIPQNLARGVIERDGIAATQHLFRPKQAQTGFQRAQRIALLAQIHARLFAQSPQSHF